ncbi:MAG: hypothetical protein IPN76_26595 [Saprospiraceae bacterium]|nr:hypothetical protein [Saprospiraceae bacterium]
MTSGTMTMIDDHRKSLHQLAKGNTHGPPSPSSKSNWNKTQASAPISLTRRKSSFGGCLAWQLTKSLQPAAMPQPIRSRQRTPPPPYRQSHRG